jgi:acyl carrier protein
MPTMDRLVAVFRRVFADESIRLSESTTADQIEGWDSLSHMNLILAVEEEFQLEFSQREAVGFRNVGELASCIDRKSAGRQP